jgi:hypothetical protein
MTDIHLRILGVMARNNQRRLNQHDAVAGPPAAGSAERRHDLQTTATRTRSRVAAALARRRAGRGV